MFCPGRVQIDHKESVTNSPIIVKCDFYRPLCFFAVYLCYCSSVCLSVSYSVCLPVCQSACVCQVCPSTSLSVCQTFCLSCGVSIGLSVCLSSLYLSLSVSYSVCLSSLSVSPFVSQSVCLATCVSVAVGFSSSSAICRSYRLTVFC